MQYLIAAYNAFRAWKAISSAKGWYTKAKAKIAAAYNWVSARSPFNPGGKVFLAVAAFLVLLLLTFCTMRRAEASEPKFIQAGIGSTVLRGEAAAIDVTLVIPKFVADADAEVGATFVGESNFKGDLQRNNFMWRAAIVDGFGRVDVGLGVAFLQNTDTYNGSHADFNLILGYRFQRYPLTLRFQHFSNGGTQSPNKGRDMVLLYYRMPN